MQADTRSRGLPLFAKLLLGCAALVVLGVGAGALVLQQASQQRRTQSAADSVTAIQRALASQAPAPTQGETDRVRLVERGSYADNYDVETRTLAALREQLGAATSVTPVRRSERYTQPSDKRPAGVDQVVDLVLGDGRQGRWVFHFDYDDLSLARWVTLTGAEPAAAAGDAQPSPSER